MSKGFMNSMISKKHVFHLKFLATRSLADSRQHLSFLKVSLPKNCKLNGEAPICTWLVIRITTDKTFQAWTSNGENLLGIIPITRVTTPVKPIYFQPFMGIITQFMTRIISVSMFWVNMFCLFPASNYGRHFWVRNFGGVSRSN